MNILKHILFIAVGLTSFCACLKTEVLFEPDISTVLRNPYMGWALYAEGHQEIDNPDEYWRIQDEPSNYANVFYVRWRWSDLEPEEGKYAWNENENFKKLIQGALDRGLRLAFRVCVNSQDQPYPATPQYVLNKSKTYIVESGLPTPYPDDEYFLEKYIKFIEAFGNKFNDPSKVDYVDSYGLGWWGEEHHVMYFNEKNKWMCHDRIVRAYEQAFDRVINVINYGLRDIMQEKVVYDELGFTTRRDGYASIWFPLEDQMKFVTRFPATPIIAEACYWKDVPIDSIEDGRWASWGDYYRDVVTLALETHANYLDLRTTVEAPRYLETAKEEVDRFISYGGYRIYPVGIKWKRDGCLLRLSHAWANAGVGVLPNNNVHLRCKYKVMFALFSKDMDLVRRVVSNNIEVSGLVGDTVLSADDVVDLSLLPKGKYTLAVGIINTIENDSKDISIAVKSAEKIAGEWIKVSEIKI